MLKRNYGLTNENISVLGLGCMRFPTNTDNSINEEKAMEIINYALNNGVNYFDTAYFYHNGQSEGFMGKALKPHRKNIFIATKLPGWLAKNKEDMDKIFNEQLERLQTDYIDFYLVHALDKKSFERLINIGLFDFLNKIKANGSAKHIGFSFHDSLDVFKNIVDAYPWEFCQIQYNFLDINYQAGLEGLKYASDKGLGIAIMEPLRGGKLVNNVPSDIMDIWNLADTKRTPTEWALKYVWNDSRVNVVLSGMSSLNNVVENIATAKISEPDTLSSDELLIIDKVRAKYESKIKVNCTDCKYCMPCPVGVNIPQNFDLLNKSSLFEDLNYYKNSYEKLDDTAKASNCVKCGKCEDVCPQSILIRKKLQEVNLYFTK